MRNDNKKSPVSALEFWEWFTTNNEQLTMLGDLEEKEQGKLLDNMQKELDAYCEGLTFEMGDLFKYVVELTDNAPDLDWWDFVAFKQPKGSDLAVTFDKYRFETKKMYFMQLESEEEPDILGLRVA